MPYRLRITAGPSLELSAQRLIRVNDDERPLEIRSPHFRGRITVRVKDFPGVFGDDSSPDENRGSSSYFDNKRATFSLQCQGTPNAINIILLCFQIQTLITTYIQVNTAIQLNPPI